MLQAWWQERRRQQADRALERQLRYQQAKAAQIAPYAETFIPAHEEYVRQVRTTIERHGSLPAAERILEVGSGAHGLVFFWEGGERIGIDPLADEYRTLFPAWQHRARTLAATGEALPFTDGTFDLVLCDNVIDHAADPAGILAEMARVLKPGGLLYFTVHVHHPLYAVMAGAYRFWRALDLPPEIPAFADHTVHLSLAVIRQWLSRHPLTLLHEDTGIPQAKADAHLRSPLPGAVLKRLFVKNARYEIVARRT